MSKPKLETFVDRITAVMIDAGVEPEQVKAELADICGVDVGAVNDWFIYPVVLPAAEYIAVLSVYFESDCVWLITGKFSSAEVVCNRHNAEVFSCAIASETIQIKHASEVTVTRGYKS